MAERAHPDDPTFRGTIYETYLKERYAFCLPYIQGCKVLDIPCGTGWGCSLLAGYASLTGLDIDATAIEYACTHFPGIQFELGSMVEMPFEDHTFDVVLCLEGLEHIYLSQANSFVTEARRVLRPNGLLILTAPLLNNGRHSMNPYHQYEFKESELRELIEPAFELDIFEVIQGGDGPEVRVVGRRRNMALAKQPRISDIHLLQHTPQWLWSLESGSGFRFSEETPPNLIGTSCVVLTFEGLGLLTDIDPAIRTKLVTYFQSCQEPETGLFRDPLLDQYPVSSSDHDEQYLLHQMSYFALQALDALDVTPLYPLRFADDFTDSSTIVSWFEQLDWSNAWLQSNRVMFVLAFLVFRAERTGDDQAAIALHAALDWLDAVQDTSGLWGERSGSSRLNAMAAAYHFLPFYEYVRRPISRINVMIDTTLTLQQSDGLFGATLGGGACEDLDAVDVLAVAAKYSLYRAEEIKQALVRAFWAIWNTRNDDGGFGYAESIDNDTYSFSSWAPLETHLHTSDAWSTWTRVVTLYTIQGLYPDDLPAMPLWNFRRWPALGYHRFGHSIAQNGRTTLPLWLRQLPSSATLDRAPVVSVVIPCYNLGLYLYDAVRSALLQTLQPIEIIVIDDGSTDELTQFILDHTEHPQLQVIRQSNQGLPATRNAGIRLAKAQYICCLDADDRLRPEFFEKATAQLQTDPTIGFVTSFYQEFDGRSGIIAYPTCGLPEMLVTNRAMVSSIFQREAWEKTGGYNETMTGMQDWELWISILAAGYRGAVIPEILFDYRVRAGSMYQTTRRPENYARLITQIIKRHPEMYERWYAEIIAGMALEFAQLVEYAEDQTRSAHIGQSLLGKLSQTEYRANVAESQIRGLQEEIRNWRTQADERAAWITQLEQAREHYIHQTQHWRELAEERAAWNAQLVEARDYHAQQSANWQAVVAEKDIQIRGLEESLSRLGEQVRNLTTERDYLLQESLVERFKRQLRGWKAARSMRKKNIQTTGLEQPKNRDL